MLKTALLIQSIVLEIDRIQAKSPFAAILSALIAGIAFLGAPSIGAAVVEIGATSVKAAANTAVVGLQQAPGLAKSMWPAGTTDSQLLQIGQVQSELVRLNNGVSQRLTSGLELLMSDVPTFLAFTGLGGFTGNVSFTIPSTTDYFDRNLRNYITSLVMAKNGWFGVLADSASLDYNHYPTLDSVQKSSFRNGVNCDSKTNICVTDFVRQQRKMTINYGYLPPDKNSAWWWSPSTHKLYTLAKDKAIKDLDGKKLMEDIQSRSWADLSLIFDGGFNCTWQGRASTGGDVNYFPGGKVDMSCVSQLPIRRTCQDSKCFTGTAIVKRDGKCPFEIMDKNLCNSA